MFWVLVSWHVTLLCLPTSFQAGSSRHRYHLQLHCVSESCHLLFCIIKKVAAMLAVKSWFSSPLHIQDAIVLTQCMHGGHLDSWLLNWRDEMWTHAFSVACHYKSVSMAYASGFFFWHETFDFEHHPYAWSIYYHTVILYGDGFQWVHYSPWPSNGLWNIVSPLCLLAIEHPHLFVLLKAWNPHTQ
jgi:hypothetical protein